MKLSKHQLCQMLKNSIPSGVEFSSDMSMDSLLDVIYDVLEESIGPSTFNREYFLRENFTCYLERYPIYRHMQMGLKSELLTRIQHNDYGSIVLASDTILRGKKGLFLIFSTDYRPNMMSFADEALSVNCDCLLREFKEKTNDGQSLYIGVAPLTSVLDF